MGPVLIVRGRPLPLRRWVTISAAIDRAVSCGVRAEVEAGRRVQTFQFLLGDAGLAEQFQSAPVGTARAHGTNVGGGESQRSLQGTRPVLVPGHKRSGRPVSVGAYFLFTPNRNARRAT